MVDWAYYLNKVYTDEGFTTQKWISRGIPHRGCDELKACCVTSINCMWMPMNDFLYHQWSHCSTIKKETTQDMFSLYVRTVNENI